MSNETNTKPTDFVMKRYLTAGVFQEAEDIISDGEECTRIDFVVFGTQDTRSVVIDRVPSEQKPVFKDIVVEGPTHIVWMPPEHFDDQYTEV